MLDGLPYRIYPRRTKMASPRLAPPSLLLTAFVCHLFQVGDEHLFFNTSEFMHLIERLIIAAEARRLDYLNTNLDHSS